MLIRLPEPKGKFGTVTVNGPEDVPDWDAIDWRAHEGNVGGCGGGSSRRRGSRTGPRPGPCRR